MLITVNRTKTVSCDHRLKANAPTDISSISILYKTSAKIKIARRKKRESAKCFFKCTSGQKDTRIVIKRKLSQSREGYSFHYVWLTLVCFGSWILISGFWKAKILKSAKIFNSEFWKPKILKSANILNSGFWKAKILKSAKILNSGFWKAKIYKSAKILNSEFWKAKILKSTKIL